LGIPLYRVSNRGYRITNQAAFHTLHPNHVTGLEGYRHIVFTRGCYPSSKNLKRNTASGLFQLLLNTGVLIVGGVDGAGGLEGTVERFTPQTMAFAKVDGSGLTPRAQHTATLLTDGRLLIAGGTTLSERAAESAEVIDFL